MDSTDINVLMMNLSTAAGVVLVAFVLVEWLKKVFKEHAGFGRIPIEVWNVGISLALASICHWVWYVNGHPLLQGEWRTLLIQVGFIAGTRKGLADFIGNPLKSIGQSTSLFDKPPPKPDAVAAQVKDAQEAVAALAASDPAGASKAVEAAAAATNAGQTTAEMPPTGSPPPPKETHKV